MCYLYFDESLKSLIQRPDTQLIAQAGEPSENFYLIMSGHVSVPSLHQRRGLFGMPIRGRLS